MQYFTQVHCLHYFTWLYAAIQELKGLRKKLYFVLLSRRKTSFYAKFQVYCSHCLPVSTWLCPAIIRTISKTGSKRVNDKLHSYALPRKKTGLLANIGATISLLHEIKNIMQFRTDNIRTERVKLIKKLSFGSMKCKNASSFFNQLLHYNVCRYGQSVKIMFTCISLMSLELKLKVKTEISLCMAIMLDNPLPSLYTQYYRTV